MENVGGEGVGQRAPIRQVVFASLIGTTIEWYDFFVYGTAAALIFNQLFFPNVDPIIGTLAAFATFGVGFLARPLGGIVFGHYGDKIGRKSMLVITLLMMGIATTLIGLLPTFDAIGIWAPVLLVILRFLQGLAVGGEWGGAVLMAVEYSPEDRRGFYGSWPQMGSPIALFLSTVIFSAFATLPDEQFLAWGWRVPFLLSIVLVGVGLFIRLKIYETPAFSEVKETNTEARLPMIDVLKNDLLKVFLAAGIVFVTIGGFYVVVTFSLSYGTETLGISRGVMLTGVIIAAISELITIPIFASLSDRVGRKPVCVWSAAVATLLAFPFFWVLGTEVAVLIWLAFAVYAGVLGGVYGPGAAFVAEQFETRRRYSGASLAYQLSGVLSGAFAPLIASALLAAASGAIWPVALYLAGLSIVSLVSAYFATETYRADIHEGVRPEVRRAVTES
ncbi:MAG: MHS family MFS transporter [Rubrobacteraceae bacterium]|nr:MHS family MFS transporter [Rubrobacteraceae bacterium]